MVSGHPRRGGARHTHKALHTAIDTLHRDDSIRAGEGLYRVMGATTGAVGGFFGVPGLLVELPVTTTLVLRAIADIARSEGENLHDHKAQRACVKVFALSGRSESDDAADTGYYEVRLALAMYAASTRSFVMQNGVAAAGAAAINVILIGHFQEMARHHFAVRRLERKYGQEPVQANLQRCCDQSG